MKVVHESGSEYLNMVVLLVGSGENGDEGGGEGDAGDGGEDRGKDGEG